MLHNAFCSNAVIHLSGTVLVLVDCVIGEALIQGMAPLQREAASDNMWARVYSRFIRLVAIVEK